MATIGQPLLTPETGWKRYDDANTGILYSGTWTNVGTSSDYNSTRTSTTVIGSSLKFYFKGTKIRIISLIHVSATSPNILIKIDGVSYNYSSRGATQISQGLLFEKDSLENKFHFVEIIAQDTLLTQLDAIDIDGNGELRNPHKKVIVKNPTTSKVYSLDNKTLIHLPSSSSKNMILHGIESGKEIKLDEDFNKMKYVKDTSEVLGIGKKYTHVVDVSKTKVNKIIL